MKKKIGILIFAILFFALTTEIAGADLDNEIILNPSNVIMAIGEDVVFTVQITILHSYCPLTLDDTIIYVPQL
ncbi:MAG: hypothetical protein ACXQS3_07110 [Candidatus Methanofastidiosia archaeon]